MFCWPTAFYYAPPPPPYGSWALAAWDHGAAPASGRHARVAMCGLPLMVIIHLMVTPLLVAHLYLACANVTTKEHMKYMQRQQAGRPGRVVPLPVPGSRLWKLYSPYDRGLIGNVAAFLRGRRDELPKNGSSSASSGQPGASGGTWASEQEHSYESHELLEVRVEHPRSPST